jgi:peptidylprolyl isomerase
VHYVGVNFSNGQEFDASWDAGAPFPVQLGTGGVIPGWERGLVGIKKGGRRKLTIPPELAYGAEGFPPSIPPNETLVFVIDAVSIE